MGVVDTAVVDADQHLPGTVGDRVGLVRLDLDHVPLVDLTRVRDRGDFLVVDRLQSAGGRRTGADRAFFDGSRPSGADGLHLTSVVDRTNVAAEVGVGRLRDHHAQLRVRGDDGATGVLHGLLGLADMAGRGLGVHDVVHQRSRRGRGGLRYGVGRGGTKCRHGQRGRGQAGSQPSGTGSSGHAASSGAARADGPGFGTPDFRADCGPTEFFIHNAGETLHLSLPSVHPFTLSCPHAVDRPVDNSWTSWGIPDAAGGLAVCVG